MIRKREDKERIEARLIPCEKERKRKKVKERKRGRRRARNVSLDKMPP